MQGTINEEKCARDKHLNRKYLNWLVCGYTSKKLSDREKSELEN